MQDETLTETLSLTDEETPLPEGWRLIRLGDVADVVNGYGFTETLQGRKDLPIPFNKFSARQSREVFNRKNHFPLFS